MYRVAAVEQLRTYADIIDLPMEVVATPREMREAVARMNHLDLVLMDTAGRSPRDEVRIQECQESYQYGGTICGCRDDVATDDEARRGAQLGAFGLGRAVGAFASELSHRWAECPG